MASPSDNVILASEDRDAPGERLKAERYDRRHDEDKGKEREEQELGEQQHPLTRQSSILSLTLDEIQNTVCEPGKTFGSMNMDEFLTNIWTAEEANPITAAAASAGPGDPTASSNPISNGNGSTAQLYRQGSLSLPAPLCRKTVDEVWSEIHRDQQQQQPEHGLQQQYPGSGNTPRQPTFGEMTLEDFLIKAGVVREGGGYVIPSSSSQFLSHQQQQQTSQNQYGMAAYSMGMGYGDHQHNPRTTTNGVYQPANFQQQQQQQQQHVGASLEGSGYGGKSSNGGGGGGYGGGAGYGGGNGKMGDGYGGVGSPVSPVSSDGFGGSQVDNPAGLWGVDIGGTGSRSGGRKRALDGPVEKVVERRQRRMIKNRESAARSRARKQAYTVELEAELNHLKEENARLQEEHRRLAAKRRQMLLDSMSERGQTIPVRRHKMLRRCSSSFW